MAIVQNGFHRSALARYGVGIELFRVQETVYCDEASLGNNLLDKDQEVFAFASVAIAPSAAALRVKSITRKYKLQGRELKGSRLIKTSSGREAVTDVLRSCEGKFRVGIHLKPYAFACKMFEYIFEPPLAEQNSIFYGIGFHLFISNLLYIAF